MAKSKPPMDLYAIGSEDGWVKVGISRSALERMAALQTANRCRLRLLARIPVKLKARHAERLAHEFLSGKERRGEWFRASREAAIEAIARAAATSFTDLLPRARMSIDEFTDAIGYLGIHPHNCLRILGITPDRFVKISKRGLAPVTIARLLRFMMKYGINGDKETALDVMRRQKSPPLSKIIRQGWN